MVVALGMAVAVAVAVAEAVVADVWSASSQPKPQSRSQALSLNLASGFQSQQQFDKTPSLTGSGNHRGHGRCRPDSPFSTLSDVCG